MPLLLWALDTPATISSVSDRDPAILRELSGLGLVPGAELIVNRKNPSASLIVRLVGQKQKIRLNNELAAHIAIQLKYDPPGAGKNSGRE